MCILFLAKDCHPDWPLIVAANRDEFFARPSAAMAFWDEHPNVLAGRDLEAGGTWLGVNRRGRFSAVTNFRTARDPVANARSRGELVAGFLQSSGGVAAWGSLLEHSFREYNPFNLVFGDRSNLFAWDHVAQRVRLLKTGYHSVSNGAIDEPWPKMARGVGQLRQYIEAGGPLAEDEILRIMQDRHRAPLAELPQTGIATEWEHALSSIFVEGEHYGTRTSTVLFFGTDRIEVTEQNYDPAGSTALARYTVALNSPSE